MQNVNKNTFKNVIRWNIMPPIIRKSLFASLVCASTSTIVEIIVSNQ